MMLLETINQRSPHRLRRQCDWFSQYETSSFFSNDSYTTPTFWQSFEKVKDEFYNYKGEFSLLGMWTLISLYTMTVYFLLRLINHVHIFTDFYRTGVRESLFFLISTFFHFLFSRFLFDYDFYLQFSVLSTVRAPLLPYQIILILLTLLVNNLDRFTVPRRHSRSLSGYSTTRMGIPRVSDQLYCLTLSQ